MSQEGTQSSPSPGPRNDSIFPQDASAQKAERIRQVKRLFQQAKSAGKNPRKGVMKFFLHIPYLATMIGVGWVGLCIEILTIMGFYSILVAAHVDKIEDISENSNHRHAKKALSSVLLLGKRIREGARDALEYWREVWKGAEAHQYPLVYLNDVINMLGFEPEVRDLNSSEPPAPDEPPAAGPSQPSSEAAQAPASTPAEGSTPAETASSTSTATTTEQAPARSGGASDDTTSEGFVPSSNPSSISTALAPNQSSESNAPTPDTSNPPSTSPSSESTGN